MEQSFTIDGATADQRIALVAGSRSGVVPSPALQSGPGTQILCGAAGHHAVLDPDREVISGDAPGHDVWFIRAGILRLQRHSFGGRRQILSFFLPGELVGYESRFREGISVETVTQSNLCRLDRRKFDALLEKSCTMRAELMRQKQDQLDRLHWLTWSIGAMGPEERLCAFLALASTFMPYQPLADGSGVLTMLMPRKDIADVLATTVESICRTLHKLADTGVIEIRDPTHFRVFDLEKLKQLGQVGSVFAVFSSGFCQRRDRLFGLAELYAGAPA